MDVSAFTQHSIQKHKLLMPRDGIASGPSFREAAGTPLIICFHGSGETCSPSWDNVAAKLVAETQCRVLLYNRGSGNLRPEDVAADMWDYLLAGHEHSGIMSKLPDQTSKAEAEAEQGNTVREHGAGNSAEAEAMGVTRDHDEREAGDTFDLSGPYLPIAHSYGGAFARAFIQHGLTLPRARRGRGLANEVLGLVLVETGQEGGLSPALDELQIRRVVMGNRPVCVIKGNIHIEKWRELEEKERTMASEAGADVDTRRAVLEAQRQMLRRVDAEDERLKRRQLGLSRKTRYVDIPDCGHGVVRDRPDEVVAAVQWVLENAESEDEEVGLWRRLSKRIRVFFGRGSDRIELIRPNTILHEVRPASTNS
ncbi:Alpha/Beta hydrolase protein [Xylariaceae sp. FL1651]|nr:Alpha/Beta hydrolase protein [Xylariaceae sp. FL1651]